MRLHGKRALVTGGSDGIGLAIAEAFAREGAELLIVGRDAGKLAAGAPDAGSSEQGSSRRDAVGRPCHRRRHRCGGRACRNAPAARSTSSSTMPASPSWCRSKRQRGAVPAILRAQCDGGVLPDTATAAASDAERGFGDQHLVLLRQQDDPEAAVEHLFAVERRAQLADQVAGLRARPARHPRQCDRARHGRHRHAAQILDNLPAAAQAELQAYVERSYPLGRIGRPTISPASPSIWPATKPHGPAAGSFAVDGGLHSGLSEARRWCLSSRRSADC